MFTLGKSFVAQAEEAIDEAQGVRMLEQHIRDAKAELDKAGKSKVDLLARVKLSHDKLNDLRERKASLETFYWRGNDYYIPFYLLKDNAV